MDFKLVVMLGLIFDVFVKGGLMKGVFVEVGIGVDIDGNKFCYFGFCVYVGILFGGYGVDGMMLVGFSVWKFMDLVLGILSIFVFVVDIIMLLFFSFDFGVTFVLNDVGFIGISVLKEIFGGDELSGEFLVMKG